MDILGKVIFWLKQKHIKTIMISQFLASFEVTLYGYMAPILGAFYFRPGKLAPFYGLLGFAITFLARPVGAIFIGRLGDKKGRKFALILSMILITFSSWIAAFLPGFEVWGAQASIIWLIARFIQGFGFGGCSKGFYIYTFEHTSGRLDSLISSILYSTSYNGTLWASVIGWIFSLSNVSCSWRWPFLVAAILGSINIFYQIKIPEHEIVLNECSEKVEINKIIRVIGLSSIAGVQTILSVYLNNLLMVNFGYNLSDAMSLHVISALTWVVMLPIAGYLCFVFGITRMMKLSLLLLIPASILGFYWLEISSLNKFYSVMALRMNLSLITSFYIAALPALISRIFNGNNRYLAISGSYSCGVGIFGGLAPLLGLYLDHYLSGAIIITFVSIIAWFSVDENIISHDRI